MNASLERCNLLVIGFNLRYCPHHAETTTFGDRGGLGRALDHRRRTGRTPTPPCWRRCSAQLHLIRAFEETVLELAGEGLVHGPAHSSIGQEGGAVGSIVGLRHRATASTARTAVTTSSSRRHSRT